MKKGGKKLDFVTTNTITLQVLEQIWHDLEGSDFCCFTAPGPPG